MNETKRNEIRTVRDRFLSTLWEKDITEQAKAEADRIAASLVLTEDGQCCFFPDVDYENQNRSEWRAAEHYTRLRRALTLAGEQKFASDDVFADRMIRGLRFWLVHDFKNPNWWHNEIGMPQCIGDIGIMTRDRLDAQDRAGVLTLVSRGSMKTYDAVAQWTGANLVWGVFNTIRHALLSEDAELLHACSDRIAKELSYAVEGVREDGAFCQHGPRWYSGGYGASFTVDISHIVSLLFGTSFSIPEKDLAILLQHILDGQRNMMLHGYFDYNGVGREIARINNTLKRSGIGSGVEKLAAIEGMPRRDELLAFAAELRHESTEQPDDPYVSCRWYPSISLLAARKNGVYIGVKCHADDQYDAEICNGEGELCYNMSYGARYCLMRRGDEYFNLDPIYDWAHVPGTTARLEDDVQILSHRNWWNLPLPNALTCGMIKGSRGIAAEKAEHDGISLYTAFFVADDCLVALGAGLRDEKKDGLPLTTTVDQCLPLSPSLSEDGTAVSNGGFTYRNLDPETELKMSVTHRVGSWKRNNFELEDNRVEGDLFLAYIPVKNGKDSYAYSVSPREKAFPVQVLSNTPDLQAVALPDGTVMAVFRKDGTLTTAKKTLNGRAGECVIL